MESGRDEQKRREWGRTGEGVRGVHLFLVCDGKERKEGRNEKITIYSYHYVPSLHFLKDKIEISHICLTPPPPPSPPPILFKLYEMIHK
jgi:hypothetical protein